jgi:UDPglucose--hexose-1-phosphate uridylyltransferase
VSPQVRVDPLTGLKTIIAGERAERPGGLLEVPPDAPVDPARDPFLPGHEEQTPPEVYRVPDGDGGWRVRAFPNLYPALDPQARTPENDASPDLFTAQPALGAHEVIVNAPEPVSSLSELSAEQVALAVDTWRVRMRAHAGAACRHLIVNERREAGASLPHTHAQLYAMDFVPAAVARERERFGAYAVRTMGGNLLADLVQEEVRRRARIVAIDDEAVLMAPYAARVPFHLVLAPRRARARFEDEGPAGAAMLHDALRRLRTRLGASPPLNLWVRTAPSGADHFCWRCRARAGGGGVARALRALVQRVSRASVTVDGAVTGAIGPGLLVLLGVTHSDTEADADRLADKVRALRVFPDADGRMNEPLGEREVLCISQFTLYGDTRKGNRPAYVAAAPPELAEPLYERFCSRLAAQRGVFGAHMDVELVNDGPVTLLLEAPTASST